MNPLLTEIKFALEQKMAVGFDPETFELELHPDTWRTIRAEALTSDLYYSDQYDTWLLFDCPITVTPKVKSWRLL